MKELIHSTGWLEAARHVNTSISLPVREPPRTNARAAQNGPPADWPAGFQPQAGMSTSHRGRLVYSFIYERPSTRLKRSEEHTSELQSLRHLVCRLLLEKKKS